MGLFGGKVNEQTQAMVTIPKQRGGDSQAALFIPLPNTYSCAARWDLKLIAALVRGDGGGPSLLGPATVI